MPPDPSSLPPRLRFLSGGGAAARLILARDWTDHPLGPPADWPDALKVALGTVLNAPDALAIAWGAEADTFFCNETYLPLIGERSTWAMGAPFRAVWGGGWPQAAPIVAAALTGPGARYVDLPLRIATDAGDAETWWSLAYSRIVDAAGEVAGLLIATADTTEQVLAERTRRETQAQLNRAQEAGGVGVFSVGADGILHGTPQFARIYGLAAHDGIPSTDVERLVVPEDAGLTSTDAKRRRGIGPRDVVYRIRRADDGALRWIARKGEIETDAAGAFVRFVGVARDVTEQILVERQLAAERDQLRQMFEQAPTFMALLRGPDHRFERVNPGYVRLIGGREIVGMTAREALPEAVAQGFQDRLDRVYATGEPCAAEGAPYLMQADPGAPAVTRYVDFVYQPLRDAAGEVVGIFIEGADVTERIEAERARRASENQFRILAEALPIQVWTARPDGPLDWFNHRILDDSGYSVEALAGGGWLDVVHPEDRAGATARWAEAVAGGRDYETEFRIRGRDGTHRWHLVRALPIRDDEGRILHWIGTNTDIHEQKLSQVESAADRDRLWRMSQDLMLVCTYAGIITAVNPSAERLLGWAPEAMIGRSLGDFIHPEDRAAPAAAVARVNEGATTLAFESRYRTSTGGYRLIAWTAVPDAGRIHAVGRDITEERALARDRERIWNVSPVLKVVTDAEGVVTEVNPSWTRTLGWTAAESIGRRTTDFMAEDEIAWAERVRALQSGNALTEYRTVLVAKGGRHHVIQWSTVPEAGNFYGFGRDVTAETEAAAALAETEAALRQSQKMEAVGQLTGGIAHDFNNLLQGITGSLEIIQRRVAQGRTAELDRFIAGAATAANRAAALTHRLLAFSRRQPLAPKPVRANTLIASMEDLLRRTIGEPIALEFVLAGGLWVTRCDPNQLESAILNLVINARDAMPHGGQVTIETCNAHLDSQYAASQRGVTPGQYVCICVTDTGTGMDAETAVRAFEPFFTTKPIGQGTGLGLSMIYGFAQQSEGYAKIYSEPGKGTTFKLYLPRHRGAAEEDEPLPAIGAAHQADAGEVVLVVEDEQIVRGLIVEELKELGYVAIEAGDGPRGLEILQSRRRIDLLVTDIGLPGLNGRQVADAARQLRPALKVLFMTGYAENAALASGFLEPGMEMITKPFAMEALATRIRAMIEG